jgi:hypothetical protein
MKTSNGEASFEELHLLSIKVILILFYERQIRSGLSKA